jgi:hypothetical protein
VRNTQEDKHTESRFVVVEPRAYKNKNTPKKKFKVIKVDQSGNTK